MNYTLFADAEQSGNYWYAVLKIYASNCKQYSIKMKVPCRNKEKALEYAEELAKESIIGLTEKCKQIE